MASLSYCYTSRSHGVGQIMADKRGNQLGKQEDNAHGVSLRDKDKWSTYCKEVAMTAWTKFTNKNGSVGLV